MNKHSIAFGAPGIGPRWTSSAKDGLGTAYHSASCIWFTLSHGIINEIYFPHVDTPNTRDLQLLITDGESFCHPIWFASLRFSIIGEYELNNVPSLRPAGSARERWRLSELPAIHRSSRDTRGRSRADNGRFSRRG